MIKRPEVSLSNFTRNWHYPFVGRLVALLVLVLLPPVSVMAVIEAGIIERWDDIKYTFKQAVNHIWGKYK